MVDIKYIQNITQEYDVSVEESHGDAEGILRTQFITIKDNLNEWLHVDVQFIDSQLYSIKFLNNDFFEVSDQELQLILKEILRGAYSIRRSGVIKRRFSLIVNSGDRKISPERVYNDAEFVSVYKKLPKQFTRRQLSMQEEHES